MSTDSVPSHILAKWFIVKDAKEKEKVKEGETKTTDSVGSAQCVSTLPPLAVNSSTVPLPSTQLSSAAGVSSMAMTAGNPFRSGKSRSSKSRSKNKTECTFSTADPMPSMQLNEGVASQVWKHIETYVGLAQVASSAAGQVFTTYGVSLSTNVTDYTDLTGLFDQYRCTRVQAWLVPRIGPAQITSAANTGLIASVVDYDDLSTPSFNQLLEYRNVLVGPGSRGHYRDFKPHVAVAAYSGSFTSYGNVEDLWIDCSSPGVQYYGVKVGLEQTDVVYTYDLIVKTSWDFRNQR
jgi:hypothetical protein